ncbi:hypothetical protein GIB67_001094 [Kingdonia uniflora]|uniref:25S rRNA (uridine-N(3))-methyltransferase BMT5-like domain-containing protein n=1 Tax=Kingdonia uniflora TaxID=39325 RepID=A0A7J7MG56_9MAGN|nr:hypothetical protein GIB67_001094 [Kingdonia uniflora]
MIWLIKVPLIASVVFAVGFQIWRWISDPIHPSYDSVSPPDIESGDFSFSACLAKAFGSANNMVATSLDSLVFLEKNYKNASSNILEIRNRGGIVLNNVDATKMAKNCLLKGRTFDRIIYNFPHAGFSFKNRTREAQIR